MKNIAIFGSSRSGKSTLSKMICKKHPQYHLIIGDDIRHAFQVVLPNNHISNKGGSGMKDDFPNFLACLFYKSIKRNKGVFNYIIDTCNITPQKAKELFDRDDTILLFLGTPKQTIKQHFDEVRKYETDSDWTSRRTDEEIIEHSKHSIEKSIEQEKECKKLGIWYVDTSFNRNEVLNETLKKLDKIILEDN